MQGKAPFDGRTVCIGRGQRVATTLSVDAGKRWQDGGSGPTIGWTLKCAEGTFTASASNTKPQTHLSAEAANDDKRSDRLERCLGLEMVSRRRCLEAVVRCERIGGRGE